MWLRWKHIRLLLCWSLFLSQCFIVDLFTRQYPSTLILTVTHYSGEYISVQGKEVAFSNEANAKVNQ